MEDPECKLGYPYSQVERILGSGRLDEFGRWMRGQTIGVCDGREYVHSMNAYRETGCGPHGAVVYTADLSRFMRSAIRRKYMD